MLVLLGKQQGSLFIHLLLYPLFLPGIWIYPLLTVTLSALKLVVVNQGFCTRGIGLLMAVFVHKWHGPGNWVLGGV